MFFKKEFKFSQSKGLVLVNEEDCKNYIIDKINHFINYENYSNKEEKLNLFHEIIDMCNYDINTATFDYSEVINIKGVNLTDLQPRMIMFYNIIFVLGGIFLYVFDESENRLSRVEEGISGAISTQSMFLSAYKELVERKNDNLAPAYGATLIFTTLIEKEIKEHTKRIYVKKYLNDLNSKIQSGIITLTTDEQELFEFLLFHYEINNKNLSDCKFDSVKATTTLQYNLLKKYNIISNDKTLEKLLLNKITLNPLIKSTLFTDIADSRFIEIVNPIFDTEMLNLRNNLAHCNFNYSNYYSIYGTALLYVIATMIADESFLK